jgi:hypothetical protein
MGGWAGFSAMSAVIVLCVSVTQWDKYNTKLRACMSARALSPRSEYYNTQQTKESTVFTFVLSKAPMLKLHQLFMRN